MIRFVLCFAASRSGATSIEYGVIAAGVLVAIIAAVAFVGGSVADLFNGTAQEAAFE